MVRLAGTHSLLARAEWLLAFMNSSLPPPPALRMYTGGHLNPAVTFSTLICGFYPLLHSILYIILQVSHAVNHIGGGLEVT